MCERGIINDRTSCLGICAVVFDLALTLLLRLDSFQSPLLLLGDLWGEWKTFGCAGRNLPRYASLDRPGRWQLWRKVRFGAVAICSVVANSETKPVVFRIVEVSPRSF